MKADRCLIQVLCDESSLQDLQNLAEAFGALDTERSFDEDDFGCPDVRLLAWFKEFYQAQNYQEVASRFCSKGEKRATCLTSYYPKKTSLEIASEAIYNCKGVYILEAVDAGGIYKIGLSTNFKKRIKGIQTGCPFELRLRFIIPCESDKEMKDLERSLHKGFASKRMSGEWFRLPDEDLKNLAILAEEQRMITHCAEALEAT